ncbi:MAG: ArsR family transcriptional regulator [Chloroflexi bacterium]|nr:MAG: ArsR family transcriptional regulator [Chloroflexota bacterium]
MVMDRKLREELVQMHVGICGALADQNRILILTALADGPCYVNELVESLGMPQSTVSRHLKVLRERGLVYAEREGQYVRYRLADDRVIQALDLLRAVMQDILREKVALAHSFEHDYAGSNSQEEQS